MKWNLWLGWRFVSNSDRNKKFLCDDQAEAVEAALQNVQVFLAVLPNAFLAFQQRINANFTNSLYSLD